MGSVITTIANAPKKVAKEVKRTAERTVSDPLGQLKNVGEGVLMTGISGGLPSPVTSILGNKVKQDIKEGLTPPELPGLPGEAGGVPDVLPPTEENVGKAVETDVELQDNLRRKRRGRASTILTGNRGLAPISEGSLARKTLLGF